MSESSKTHHERAEAFLKDRLIRCAILTVSDSRTLETDESGSLIERLLSGAGHLTVSRRLVPDEVDEIEAQLREWINDPTVQVVLTTGGTGFAKRDTTVDVVRRLLTVEIEGFGELFRMLSWKEVHAAAMVSRALGGVVVRSPNNATETEVTPDLFLFSMPGSRNAVRTAMKNLILPQLPHLVWERSR